MYKILVPVDFSEKSNYAVKMAAKIGKNIEAEIYLLHLVELPSGIVDMGAGSNFSIPESMMYLRKVKEKILDLKATYFHDDQIVRYSIKFQNPFEGITDYVKKINANLIVMGSKGVSDFEEMIIGSNTEKVVRTSTIPVIVVALLQFGIGFDFYMIVGLYLLLQALDGNLLVPILFSDAVKLHPVVIMLAVFIFGGIFGFWGAFFSIPLATFIKAVWNSWPSSAANNEY